MLAATTAWWLVAVGALCILAAWFYTGGSHPYGYLGLGEVMVFVFFGLVAVIGTAYVQSESFTLPALYAAVGIGALACAILVANNLRDIPTDREVGKRTLAVVLGDERTRGFYALLVGLALVALVALVLATSTWAALGALGLLVAARAARVVLGGAQGRDAGAGAPADRPRGAGVRRRDPGRPAGRGRLRPDWSHARSRPRPYDVHRPARPPRSRRRDRLLVAHRRPRAGASAT